MLCELNAGTSCQRQTVETVARPLVAGSLEQEEDRTPRPGNYAARDWKGRRGTRYPCPNPPKLQRGVSPAVRDGPR